MKQDLISSFVRSCEDEYKKMVGLDSFPVYEIIAKDITLQKSQQHGFDSVAATFYDVQTGNHKLEIWSQLYLPQMNAKYLVFHEFTHIWDAEVYSQRDKIKHTSNRGYTEFHAAQIDLLCLLGVKEIASPRSFSMRTTFETLGGKKTVAEFVDMPRLHATEMIKRKDFPESIEALATTMGLIFNYYGRRSVCKMYSTDYDDSADMSVIASYIHPETVDALDKFLVGWPEKALVALVDTLYQRMVVSLAQQANL